MNLDDALKTFVAECRDLLQQMEHALLEIEDNPGDTETMHAIFRAAHTIKGSAGLFGLDEVVAFTHVAESVLEEVRGGQLVIDRALAALLLKACDHIGALVDHVDIEVAGALSEEGRSHGASLVANLQLYLGQVRRAPAAVALAQPQDAASEGGGAVETDNWHISLRFGSDVLRNGMDPLAFIRYLGTLGQIENIIIVCDAVPDFASFDPECCYLGFEVSFRSQADKATIESVFEFVREDSQIRILPPHSMVSAYLALIGELSDDDMRLGEILVKCGTLTEAELRLALSSQDGNAGQRARPIGEVLVAEQLVRPKVVAAALERQKQVKEGKGGESSLIRVDADKLDQLINQIGELVIAGAGVNLIARGAASQAGLLEAASTLSRLVEEVRDSALTLRMVEIGSTFNRFQRVVHDVSRSLGKEIALCIEGADTELDKTVVEKIGDPLTHLVRNAIDHGIELPELRVARGKPARGTLRLNAFHDSGSIVIEVSDDGAGLSRERVLRKAVERGIVAEGDSLSDQDILNLVFEPGFSTAEQVSDLSGRGVGMDVVRRNILALRGSVDLESVDGEGTTVRIRLPLTLAIIDGFLVGVGKAAFVIPLDLVVECIELSPQDRQAESERNYIALRGQVLPYLNLREMFDIQGEPSRRANLVVVQYCGTRIGLVVDFLLGEIQTVIKPLGRVFGDVNGIGGSTILGNGSVALILDVAALVRRAVSVQEKRLAEPRPARNHVSIH